MKRLTPIKAIREFCKQCTAGDVAAIKDCKPLPDVTACPIWPYRMGKNPNVSEATRIKQRELAKSRNFPPKPKAAQEI